ncbi:hypothetical protein [Thermocaproicibacter melissae]|jgi:polysaccharide deacetylase 2 family uncharacterized protein YibQ|uniref:hypothetical protein n=1 Tax=Thermocaproicibacter melissae TaxID=2966552 RepID=UPI0024B0A11D|nr:hypothetical protein [Thermocaproicibacter melissae]WBY63707.1 hypothetical protein NOG13_06985 [Thermocaproicibacter melissae]
MASNQLIIDEDYWRDMASFFEKQGKNYESMIQEYVQTLKAIRDSAIIDGAVSAALSEFITYAEKLENQIGSLSTRAKSAVNQFLADIDAKDQYQF